MLIIKTEQIIQYY